jgi:hypothetical protein
MAAIGFHGGFGDDEGKLNEWQASARKAGQKSTFRRKVITENSNPD